MKKSMTRVILAAGFAGAALLSLSAASWSMGPGGMGHDPGRMIAHMAERLDLSESQRSQAEQIVNSSKGQFEQYRDELHSLREQLRAMRGSFDQDTARSISDRIGVITSDLVYQYSEVKAEVYGLLTEQQRAKMDEMMQQREERRGKWHKRSRDTQDEE